ncbi:hypothetical protein PIB30_010270 [Stylosanthes scabra]|uniref:Uncharacterized protein n=1 Tax=Stylosanthes scabra TaxID=79078 RepID=A0ABU6T7K6_9FABA|nr:hypothetical protein [Stylosanthes scabra]
MRRLLSKVRPTIMKPQSKSIYVGLSVLDVNGELNADYTAAASNGAVWDVGEMHENGSSTFMSFLVYQFLKSLGCFA